MGEQALPKVSVIVVNYRGAEHTVTCLRALRDELDWPPEALELVCVDNASGDGSPEQIVAAVPHRLLAHHQARRPQRGGPVRERAGRIGEVAKQQAREHDVGGQAHALRHVRDRERRDAANRAPLPGLASSKHPKLTVRRSAAAASSKHRRKKPKTNSASPADASTAAPAGAPPPDAND